MPEKYWLVDSEGNPVPGEIQYGPVLDAKGEAKFFTMKAGADGLLDISKQPKSHAPVIETEWHSPVETHSHPLTDKDPKGKT